MPTASEVSQGTRLPPRTSTVARRRGAYEGRCSANQHRTITINALARTHISAEWSMREARFRSKQAEPRSEALTSFANVRP
jgi:hypothetical protein